MIMPGVTRTAAAMAFLLASPGASPAPAPSDDSAPRLAFTILDPRVTESSGLAVSALHPGVYWTHNDSGDGPCLYAVGSDGRTRATVTLQGVSARDWEAVAAGRDESGRPALFVADIGDNRGTWPEVTVYRIPEPQELRDQTVAPVRYRVRFADGPRDAEALMVDPRTNALSIASKEASGGLYVQPDHLSTTEVNVFRRLPGVTVPPFATDGAFSPDGSRFVIRGYFTATEYAAPERPIGPVAVPPQKQGESVAFTSDGRALLMGSEGRDSPVWRVPLTGDQLPDSARAAAPPPAPSVPPARAGARKTVQPPDLKGGGLGSLTAVVALLVAALGVVGWRRARRHHR